VLVTGSREVKDRAAVWRRLDYLAGMALAAGYRVVVVHGDCESGADRLAREWAVARARQGARITQDPHPADWEAPCVLVPPAAWNGPGDGACHHGPRRWRGNRRSSCPFAGHRRNQQMTDLVAARRAGGDPVRGIAFYQEGAANRGTADCRARMERAGIPVVPVRVARAAAA
jgi:YspA, cpYpsA-related SLOG family